MKKAFLIGIPVLLVFLGVGFSFSDQEQEKIHLKSPELPMLAFGGVRLGVLVSEINPHLRQALKIDSGVLVENVMEDSPAEQAGIKEGDIILKIGNQAVDSQKDIREYLQNLEDSEQVEVQILRDGKPLTVQVNPEKSDIRNFNMPLGGKYIGVNLQELDSDLAGYFKVDPNSGVLITSVEPESPASKAGIRSGDILTHFNGKKINSPEEVREELNGLREGETAEITLLRQANEMKVTVEPVNRPFHGKEFMQQIPDVMAFTRSPEFKEEMNNLKQDMEQMKRDLQLREKDIEQLKTRIEKELQLLKDELDHKK
jgi:membrane-associated protease RseP (regulator of RpoE activity)